MTSPLPSWIDDARKALEAADQSNAATHAFALVRLLASAGRDEEAERVASEMRKGSLRTGAHRAWTEAALAWIALSIDNDEGVHAHVAAARAAAAIDRESGGISARSWIDVLAFLHTRRLGGEAFEEIALALDDLERGGETRDVGAMKELERGWSAVAQGRDDEALLAVPQAIEAIEKQGLVRLAGRTMVAWSEHLATRGDAMSAGWLARAQTVLGKTATWRDRIQLHRGFIARGRRMVDRAMNDPAAARVEAFERARGAAVSSIANAVDLIDASLAAAAIDAEKSAATAGEAVERARQATLAVRGTSAPAFVGLDRVARDLVDLVGGALVERERLRGLLDAFHEIDRAANAGELPSIVAGLTGKLLECDRVLVAIEREPAEPEVVVWGQGEGPVDARAVLARAARERDGSGAPRRMSEAPGVAPRAESKPRGADLVVAIRAGALRGAIYADKSRRAGQFREEDSAFAAIVAESFALALAKLDAREKERASHQQLAVTIDAIREGVIACDGTGAVTAANAAAARMLRIEPAELVGARLDRVPSLGPLAAQLGRNPRLDGAVVRLAHASFVVGARPIAEGNPAGGFVATLVELERAQKIAQKVVGSRARYTFRDVVGESPALRAAIAVAHQATTIDANVLVTGESGTGKEVVAQAIHSAGNRSQEPFVGLNCAALPHDLLEAELFGYERGAFTGARAEGNMGKFELAGGGTILLDEIGDMPLGMQAKLLRVLQERVVTRLGGSRERPVEARVIATTHRDLEQLVSEGKFRLDLLFRLRVLSIELPTLRERPGDIALLAATFVERFAEQQGKAVRTIAPNVLEELTSYAWPGNVRELANVVEAEVSLLAPDATTLRSLSTRLGARTSHWSLPPTGEFPIPSRVPTSLLPASTAPSTDGPILPLAEVEKRAFLHALAKCQNNVPRAAEALGVSKVTFYAKLRSWHLHPKDRESTRDLSTLDSDAEPGPVTRRSQEDKG